VKLTKRVMLVLMTIICVLIIFELQTMSGKDQVTAMAKSNIQGTINKQYGFTEKDIYLLAQLLCGDEKKDGDGEYDFVGRVTSNKPYYLEMSKVLCVVMNRQRSTNKYYPDTVQGVVLQKNQFTPMSRNRTSKPSKIAIEKIREWCQAYDNYDPKVQVIPKSHIFFCAGKNNTNVTRANYK